MDANTLFNTFDALKADNGERYATTVLAISKLLALIPGIAFAFYKSGAPDVAVEAAKTAIAQTMRALCHLGGFEGQEERIMADAEGLIGGAQADLVIHRAKTGGAGAAPH